MSDPKELFINWANKIKSESLKGYSFLKDIDYEEEDDVRNGIDAASDSFAYIMGQCDSILQMLQMLPKG